MKNLVLAFSVLVFVGCVSKENRAVNDPVAGAYVPVISPIGLGGGSLTSDVLGRAANPALQGKVLVDGAIPQPVRNVRVVLSKKNGSQWKELGQLTTDQDGQFVFTQSLTRGDYELRIVDKKYSGVLSVTLDSEPQLGLVILVK